MQRIVARVGGRKWNEPIRNGANGEHRADPDGDGIASGDQEGGKLGKNRWVEQRSGIEIG